MKYPVENGFENTSKEHIPVLADYLAERLEIPRDGVIVDATVGHGGHSLLLGTKLGPEGLIIGLDVDEKCIKRAHLRLSCLACRVILVRENFSLIEKVLCEQGISRVDLILADLGFCSAQVFDAQRGLSFQENMPLDMRFDSRLEVSAAQLVNHSDEQALADLIYKYGQERASRRIARFIVQRRSVVPIRTTGELSAVICRALGAPVVGFRGRIHPATRTFQALRIAVNDELGNLQRFLAGAAAIGGGGGYRAVISYHSLEDGMVKGDFRANVEKGIYRILTSKPVVPGAEEIEKNPSARGAKLRIAQKVVN